MINSDNNTNIIWLRATAVPSRAVRMTLIESESSWKSAPSFQSCLFLGSLTPSLCCGTRTHVQYARHLVGITTLSADHLICQFHSRAAFFTQLAPQQKPHLHNCINKLMGDNFSFDSHVRYIGKLSLMLLLWCCLYLFMHTQTRRPNNHLYDGGGSCYSICCFAFWINYQFIWIVI